MKGVLFLAVAVVLLVMAIGGLLWVLLPIAFPGMVVGYWQACAMAVLVLLFGGGILFVGDHL
jgi:hypothetical protein